MEGHCPAAMSGLIALTLCCTFLRHPDKATQSDILTLPSRSHFVTLVPEVISLQKAPALVAEYWERGPSNAGPGESEAQLR